MNTYLLLLFIIVLSYFVLFLTYNINHHVFICILTGILGSHVFPLRGATEQFLKIRHQLLSPTTTRLRPAEPSLLYPKGAHTL